MGRIEIYMGQTSVGREGGTTRLLNHQERSAKQTPVEAVVTAPPLGIRMFNKFDEEARKFGLTEILTKGDSGKLTAKSKKFTRYFYETVVKGNFAEELGEEFTPIWEIYREGSSRLDKRADIDGRKTSKLAKEMLRRLVSSVHCHHMIENKKKKETIDKD